MSILKLKNLHSTLSLKLFCEKSHIDRRPNTRETTGCLKLIFSLESLLNLPDKNLKNFRTSDYQALTLSLVI